MGSGARDRQDPVSHSGLCDHCSRLGGGGQVLWKEGGHPFLPWLFSPGPSSPFSYGPAADAAGLQLLLCALLLPRQETHEDPRATRKTQMRDSSVMTQEKLDRSLPKL